MFKSYLLIAFRSLLKNKLFSFINILSLSLSMTLCMMTMLKTMDTLSYDTFHKNGDRIYRIISEIHNNDGGQWTLASSPLPLLERINNDLPFIESSTHLYPIVDVGSDGVKEISINSAFTSPAFFKVFDFTLEHGNPQAALEKPKSVVLSKKAARKFFDMDDPTGKLISFKRLGTFVITGILKDNQSKSHIDFEAYLSASSVEQLELDKKLPEKLKNWNSFENAYTYVLLRSDAERIDLDRGLGVLTKEINKGATSGKFILRSQALTSITPGTDSVFNDIGRGGSWGKIFAEVGVAFIILLAAAFNYTNLSIARALTRMREVAIRKVAGAKRAQIFFQFIAESVLVAIAALAIALVFLSFILEYQPFNDGYEAVPVVQLNLYLLFIFLVLAIFSGVLAGAMPAWILSSFKAIRLMKNVATEKIMTGLTLRKVLLVFQFTVSITVLIFLTVFYRQFSFMATADPGYRTENILSIPFSGHDREIITNELSRLSDVENISSTSENFGGRSGGTLPVALNEDEKQPFKFHFYTTDEHVLEVFGLTLIAGRNFESNKKNEVFINETAVTTLGFKTAKEAVGQTLWVFDSMNVSVAGVVKDFYYQGVGNAVTPLVLTNDQGNLNFLNVRISSGQDSKALAQIESTWKRVFPDRAFAFSWLQKDHQERHGQRASISFLGFLSFMTITIAALGLLGLVVYTVETKRKEISIRKIIGADIRQLLVLLSKGFVTLLLTAGFIAIPVGYVAGQFFLMNFANRISIGAGTLVFSFLFLLALGLSMILSQTYKAASANPVDALRSE
jgi:putative ABC transport system permease protein